ncbi:MAG: ATP-binding protein [Angelakisella sp.]
MDLLLVLVFGVIKTITLFVLFLEFRFRLRFGLWLTVSIFSGYNIVVQIITLFLVQFGAADGSWRLIWSIIASVIGTALFFFLFQASPWKLLFALLLTKSYLDCLDLLAATLSEECCSVTVQPVVSLPFLLAFSVLLLLSFWPMRHALKKLVYPLMDSTASDRLWKYLWVNPTLFYLLDRLVISDRYLNLSPDPLHQQYLIPLIWTTAVFGSYFIMVLILTEAERSHQLREQLKVADLQVAMQRRQFDSIGNLVSSTQRMRHDLRHHVLAAQGYAQAGDLPGLQAYLNTLAQITERTTAVLCANPAVNMITGYYLELAESKGIKTELSIRLPQQLPIGESDFCVVLGNLLENAMEGASVVTPPEKRFLSGKILLVDNNKVAIMIRNSCVDKIRKNGEAFVSTKHAGDGIGTASVREIARKYSGVTRFTVHNGVFEASVLLSC